MRIRIEHERCRGAGQCALTAPDLFDQSEDDGTVIVLDERPGPRSWDSARLAARLCPNAVISIDEDEA